MSKKGGNKEKVESKETEEHFITSLLKSYMQDTPARVKMIDCFIIFQLLTAVLVLVYGFLFCHNPLNAFLAALFSCMGSFVFTSLLFCR